MLNVKSLKEKKTEEARRAKYISNFRDLTFLLSNVRSCYSFIEHF